MAPSKGPSSTPPNWNAERGSIGLPVLAMGLIAALLLGSIAAFVVLRPTGPGQSGAVRTSGEALVGGSFSMVDHTGSEVTDGTYSGRLMVVYFGFTYCPDVCPTQLLVLSEALDRLGEDAEQIAPLFVTVDPERDTPEALAQYVSNFHPNIVGLTGSPEQLRTMADAYYVSYYKVQDEAASDYLMDHTSIVYVMDRSGTYLTHFTHATSAEEMAGKLKDLL